ncbi:MAG: hypothetical protein EOP88_05655 [Verrucomicrobiaceae bacterium]|nr:MAG: hypothetical protein EOP88_05655 [Verrucomicrobiaceae bacterium]
MGLKAVIALLLGLVIQFSQVQSGFAALVSSCKDTAEPMSCCQGPDSCPCLSETNTDQKPAPVIPAGIDLKWFVSKSTEPDRLVSASSACGQSALPATRARDSFAGYAGVPLSVAFCSFVI